MTAYMAIGNSAGVRLTMSVALAAVVSRTPTIQVTKWRPKKTAPGSVSSRSRQPNRRPVRRRLATPNGVSSAAANSSRAAAIDNGGQVHDLINSTDDAAEQTPIDSSKYFRHTVGESSRPASGCKAWAINLRAAVAIARRA